MNYKPYSPFRGSLIALALASVATFAGLILVNALIDALQEWAQRILGG